LFVCFLDAVTSTTEEKVIYILPDSDDDEPDRMSIPECNAFCHQADSYR